MDESMELGRQLGFWTLAPFALMLLAVAICPLCFGCWFDKNRNKAIVAFVLGVPTVVYLIGRFGDLASTCRPPRPRSTSRSSSCSSPSSPSPAASTSPATWSPLRGTI